MQKYVLDKEDSWVLDRALLKFVGDVLRSISAETKVRIMRVLAVCALKESFVAFLHQVRRCVEAIFFPLMPSLQHIKEYLLIPDSGFPRTPKLEGLGE